MSESEQPKRGRGRPRVNPVEGNRRNVTLQVSNELYETLKAASEQSGVSISREMEQRVQNSFTQNDIIAAAVEGASKAATARMDEQYVQFFGGRPGMLWAKGCADAYNEAFAFLLKVHNITEEAQITEEFRDALAEIMKDKQDEISNMWLSHVHLSRALNTLSNKEGINGLMAAINDNPKLKAALEKNFSAYLKRRQGKDNDTGE